MDEFEKKYLEQLGIYELRAKARAIGVKSPTTKRHGELVDCILKIQNGEQQAFSTKKGRPPKNVNFINSALDLEKIEGEKSIYTYAQDCLSVGNFCDDSYVEAVKPTTYKCQGLVREMNGKQYVFDYYNAVRFVFVEEQRLEGKKLFVGDFVKGRVFYSNPTMGVLAGVDDVNLQSLPACKNNVRVHFALKQIASEHEVYQQISNQSVGFNIALELEVDDNKILQMRDKCFYLHSGEYDDLKRSYNAIMDCMNVVKNLCASKKQFAVHLIDIDYIFSLLNAYLVSEGKRQDVDAGQFLRDMILCIKNSGCGNLTVYHKPNYKRNAYLDAILNKYL